jgi:hypothetical protein
MVITLARKPLTGSITGTILASGCGGLNIDKTRIEGPAWKWGTQADLRGGGFGTQRPSEGFVLNHNVESNPKGRWTANVILQHQEKCQFLGVCKVKGVFTGNGNAQVGIASDHIPLCRGTGIIRADENGQETIDAWDCSSNCPVLYLNIQGGISKGVVRKPTGKAIYNTDMASVIWNDNNVKDTTIRGFDDMGFVSRFFKQVKL